VALTGLVAGTLFAVPAAQAETPSSAAATRAADTAVIVRAQISTGLETQLGNRAAGSYQDASGNLVVNVTDQASFATVKATGATPRLVKNSMATLNAASAELTKNAKIPGTAWSVDPVSNVLLVHADSTVTGAKLAKVKAEAAKFGSAVKVTSIPGKISLRITGGDAIYHSPYRCSLGFNVLRGGQAAFLTAGHCGNLGGAWSNSSGQVIGQTAGSSFPGNDYAIVTYTANVSRPGHVDMYPGENDIARASSAYVGEGVSRSGSTTHVHSGTVLGVNATVNYAEGSVSGLIYTNVCAEGGDSGGSLFTGNVALGLTSGGSGNCSGGGQTYFQPVTEPLSVYGASIY
jgi:streptogrisin D